MGLAPRGDRARLLEPLRRADVEPQPREREAFELAPRDRRVEPTASAAGGPGASPANERGSKTATPAYVESGGDALTRSRPHRARSRRAGCAADSARARASARAAPSTRTRKSKSVNTSEFTSTNGSQPEQRQRVHDAAAGLERRLAFLAVVDRHAEAAAVAEVLANLRCRDTRRLMTISSMPLAASRTT